MALPAAGYLSNSARTQGEMKTALEDFRDVVAHAMAEATVASGAAGLVLTAASARTQSFTSTAAGQSVTLPDATTLAKGDRFLIRNAGGSANFNFDVKANGGTTLIALTLGYAVLCVLEDNATAAGTWYTHSDKRSIQSFTASGIYTKPAGLRAAKIFVTGGGGGGGDTSGDLVNRGGGGGSAGGTAIKQVSAALLGATETVTVGAAGAGGSPGATGGTSSMTITGGLTVQATGGIGASPGSAASPSADGGGAPGVATNGDINLGGGSGSPGVNAPQPVGGNGGASYWGGGGRGKSLGAGGNGLAYGSGGGGSSQNSGSGSGNVGGPGVAGIVVVEEFY